MAKFWFKELMGLRTPVYDEATAWTDPEAPESIGGNIGPLFCASRLESSASGTFGVGQPHRTPMRASDAGVQCADTTACDQLSWEEARAFDRSKTCAQPNKNVRSLSEGPQGTRGAIPCAPMMPETTLGAMQRNTASFYHYAAPSAPGQGKGPGTPLAAAKPQPSQPSDAPHHLHTSLSGVPPPERHLRGDDAFQPHAPPVADSFRSGASDISEAAPAGPLSGATCPGSGESLPTSASEPTTSAATSNVPPVLLSSVSGSHLAPVEVKVMCDRLPSAPAPPHGNSRDNVAQAVATWPPKKSATNSGNASIPTAAVQPGTEGGKNAPRAIPVLQQGTGVVLVTHAEVSVKSPTSAPVHASVPGLIPHQQGAATQEADPNSTTPSCPAHTPLLHQQSAPMQSPCISFPTGADHPGHPLPSALVPRVFEPLPTMPLLQLSSMRDYWGEQGSAILPELTRGEGTPLAGLRQRQGSATDEGEQGEGRGKEGPSVWRGLLTFRRVSPSPVEGEKGGMSAVEGREGPPLRHGLPPRLPPRGGLGGIAVAWAAPGGGLGGGPLIHREGAHAGAETARSSQSFCAVQPRLHSLRGGWTGAPGAYASAAITQAPSRLVPMVAFDELRIITLVGEGGFGKVYYGHWRNTPVAIKVAATRNSNSTAIEFEREVATQVAITPHPNIVKMLAACNTPPHLAIVTEYCSRGSLYSLLHNPSTPATPLRQVLAYWLGISRGMCHLHQQSPPVLHRDLKSANVLVSDIGVAMISDFGLARIHSQGASAPLTGGLGTFQWMAPEVLSNQAYSEKADIYSFGVVMWECLARKLPFAGLSAMQAALGVVNQGLRPQFPNGTPPDVQALIRACWAAVPDQRPPFSSICTTLQGMLDTAMCTQPGRQPEPQLLLPSPSHPLIMPGEPQSQLPTGGAHALAASRPRQSAPGGGCSGGRGGSVWAVVRTSNRDSEFERKT